ncbi:aspartate carbamoyltransferase [PVC group bacterium (ex Bugula neritina AB1)]|nr:aspartate carbamoyltransferase [PVC group bacterium (ex Bugula neritina AB1)]
MPDWSHRHLLDIKSLSQKEIEYIMTKSDFYKKSLSKGLDLSHVLRGKTLVNLFFENSTRTRASFELAEKHLGANVFNISTSLSSITKGETFFDTLANIESLGADMLIIRHPSSGILHQWSKKVNISMINAGDGMNEHPSQALIDLYTIREHKSLKQNLTVAMVGDIVHSRVARSNIWALSKFGITIHLVSSKNMLPNHIKQKNIKFYTNLKEGLKDADIIMLLRVQKERQALGFFSSFRDYAKINGLKEDFLTYSKKDVLIMHPGPVNWGVEMAPRLAQSKNCVILDQVKNGIAVRMAILDLTHSAINRKQNGIK